MPDYPLVEITSALTAALSAVPSSPIEPAFVPLLTHSIRPRVFTLKWAVWTLLLGMQEAELLVQDLAAGAGLLAIASTLVLL